MSYEWLSLCPPYGLGQNPYPYYVWSPWTIGWRNIPAFNPISSSIYPYTPIQVSPPLPRGYTPAPYPASYQYPNQLSPYQGLYPSAIYAPRYPYFTPQTPQVGDPRPYPQQISSYPPVRYIPSYPYYSPQYSYQDP